MKMQRAFDHEVQGADNRSAGSEPRADRSAPMLLLAIACLALLALALLGLATLPVLYDGAFPVGP